MQTQNYTVNQARSIIRFSSTPERLNAFLTHPDARVQRNAANKLRTLGQVVTATLAPEPPAAAPIPPAQPVSTEPSQEEMEVAMKYDLSVEELRALVEVKGSLAAAKRSLSARKAAQARNKKSS